MNRIRSKSLTLLCIMAGTVASACLATAQETEIVSVSTGGTLTWTNVNTNTSCGLEYVLNLSHEWVPLAYDLWRISPTGTLHSVQLDLTSLLDQLAYITPRLPGFGVGPWIFFRVVSASNSLENVDIVNNIRFLNASTSEVTNVTIGEFRGMTTYWSTNIGTLLPADGTAYFPMIESYPRAPSQFPEESGPKTWFARYTHEGAERTVNLQVFIWGPTNMSLTVAASNGCQTIRYEWLELEGRYPYL